MRPAASTREVRQLREFRAKNERRTRVQQQRKEARVGLKSRKRGRQKIGWDRSWQGDVFTETVSHFPNAIYTLIQTVKITVSVGTDSAIWILSVWGCLLFGTGLFHSTALNDIFYNSVVPQFRGMPFFLASKAPEHQARAIKKYMFILFIFQVWCGRMWLASRKSWLKPQRVWMNREQGISGKPYQCCCDWIGANLCSQFQKACEVCPNRVEAVMKCSTITYGCNVPVSTYY